jgi:hypothetical protein
MRNGFKSVRSYQLGVRSLELGGELDKKRAGAILLPGTNPKEGPMAIYTIAHYQVKP